MPANEQGITPERYQLIPRVLVFIIYEQEVLLIKGAPNKRIWANKYNGIGGHVERGESIYSAARREVLEETGLTATDFHFCATITIDAGQPAGIGLFVYTARANQREITDSDEGTLEWVPIQKVLEWDLVEDLHTLLPKVLERPASAAPFFGRYWYDSNGQLQMTFEELNQTDA